MMCCWVLITLMYTPSLSTHLNLHLQTISRRLSTAFCEMYMKTPPGCRASTHRSLDHFNNHFLCLAARGGRAARGQMCSTLNTLKAKTRTIELFLQSKQHQSPDKLFHLGLKPLQLPESGDWSHTAQLSAIQLCLAGSHTMLDYNCLHCAALQGRGKSHAAPHLPVHLRCHVIVTVELQRLIFI